LANTDGYFYWLLSNITELLDTYISIVKKHFSSLKIEISHKLLLKIVKVAAIYSSII